MVVVYCHRLLQLSVWCLGMMLYDVKMPHGLVEVCNDAVRTLETRSVLRVGIVSLYRRRVATTTLSIFLKIAVSASQGKS